MLSLKVLLLVSCVAVMALASVSLDSSPLDVDEYESALASQQFDSAAAAAQHWLQAARGGRGRRELGAGDTEFRICGKELLTETREICKICPKKDKRSVSSPVFSRFRRASISTKISNMCCINKCRPSEVRAVCCV